MLITDGHELAALGAVRSLGRAGHKVVVSHPTHVATSPATVSRFCAGATTHPDPWQEHGAMREWLRIQISSGRYDVVLPVTEAAIVAAAAVRREVQDDVTLLMPSDEDLRYSLSKYTATRAALAAGLTVPSTVFIRGDGVTHVTSDAFAELDLPVVVKTDNYLDGDRYVKGRTRVCHSYGEAARLLERISETPGSAIAQQHVAGRGLGGFMLRFNGQAILRFAHARIHEVPITGGMSSLRVSTDDGLVLGATEKLLDFIGYEGLAMVEFRGEEGADPHFLEINGRLWGSIALALHAGVDFPLAWLQCVHGGGTTLAQPTYPTRVRSRNLEGELGYLRSVLEPPATAASNAPSKVGTVIELALLSIDPRVHGDTFWLRDPAPGLAVLASTARRVQRRGVAVVRSVRSAATDAVLVRRLRRLNNYDVLSSLPRPAKVCFLCFGNICRSPFAERYWQQTPIADVDVVSAGFHPRAGRRSPEQCALAAGEHDVDLAGHRSRVVTADLLEQSDVVFVMDLQNYRALIDQFPRFAGKVLLLGLFGDGAGRIADPYCGTPEDGVKIFGQIARSIDDVKARIIASQ